MGEVTPSSKPPKAPPSVFSHPSLCVDVKGNLGEPRPKQCDLLEARYRPSHCFPPNLLDASCLCKRFVVFDISVLLLQYRGVWKPHHFASPGLHSGSLISMMLSRN